jgi:hypothetical protein
VVRRLGGRLQARAGRRHPQLTCLAARDAARLPAIDARPEVLAINADKLGAERERVKRVVADLFAW